MATILTGRRSTSGQTLKAKVNVTRKLSACGEFIKVKTVSPAAADFRTLQHWPAQRGSETGFRYVPNQEQSGGIRGALRSNPSYRPVGLRSIAGHLSSGQLRSWWRR